MMELARRGFLGSMALAVSSRFLPDTLIYDPSLKLAAPDDSLAIVNLETVTRAIQKEFEKEYKRIAGPSIAFDDVVRMGGSVGTQLKQVEMSNHLMVQTHCFLHGENRDIHKRYIEPIAYSLAAACKNKGINVFGALGMPHGGTEAARCTSSHSSIRGVMQWSLPLIFDVIGGHLDMPKKLEPSRRMFAFGRG